MTRRPSLPGAAELVRRTGPPAFDAGPARPSDEELLTPAHGGDSLLVRGLRER
ncbi:hypothetical protein [Actinosynnema sp. NPDC023587]|uniref:hypothetical protein n=1 Tax=Actinosynnema sp. NPDC023587 TaxID=3154695 RepID=UPI0034097B0D